jgi:hypothetical protein
MRRVANYKLIYSNTLRH